MDKSRRNHADPFVPLRCREALDCLVQKLDPDAIVERPPGNRLVAPVPRADEWGRPTPLPKEGPEPAVIHDLPGESAIRGEVPVAIQRSKRL